MEPSQIINGVAIALIVAVILFGLNVKSALVRIETILTGAKGENGLVGNVKQLNQWRQDLEQQALDRRLESLEHERRHGPDDRRQSA